MKNIKIAYIGGGSKLWARSFMQDLALAEGIRGEVALFDTDREAAVRNQKIATRIHEKKEAVSQFTYTVADTLPQALTGADFVLISILPGTFKEMESDVHTPEKYGIYQSVGDTSGPGGILRALRTVPMMEVIARAVEKCCPEAWVINYTNPMTLSVKALYDTFPGIKAFGCCHEVFGTQKLMMNMLKEKLGITGIERKDIKVNVVGVNHFTWLTAARYRNIDLFPMYEELAREYGDRGFCRGRDENWMNDTFACCHKVKFDLFKRFGMIAAAGDRHLAEFCDGNWYLKDPQTVRDWGFGLTTVAHRKKDLIERQEKSRKLREGEMPVEITLSGEEGVSQMRAILGLREPLVTNVNIPNVGQIPNLPMGAVVETNAVFRSGSVTPVMAGEIPTEIHPLVSRICTEQEMLDKALANRDLGMLFNAFAADPLVTCCYEDAKKLFNEMVLNTKEYLGSYDLSKL